MKAPFRIIVLLSTLLAWVSFLHGQTMEMIVSNEVGAPGDTVVVSIEVVNFTGVGGYQGTARWDSSILNFIDHLSPTSGIGNFFGNPGQGIIPLDAATFSWVDFSGGTSTLTDSTPVLDLRFEIKSNAPSGITPVTIDGSVTNLAYSNGVNLFTPVAVGGSVNVSGCTPTANASFTLPAAVCQGASNPLATITGDTGGTFSVDNGASINVATGELDLATTTIGTTYSVTYTVGVGCPALAVQTIQVLPIDDASFTIVDSICVGASNPMPSITGLLGGQFSVDNGATINAVSGELDMSTVVAGTAYTLTYQSNGPCPSSSSQIIYVRPLDDPSFSLPSEVCVWGANPIAVINGLSGGIFAIDFGAFINSSTGEIDLTSTQVDSTYQVTYTTQGACPNSSQQSILVSSIQDASFQYPAEVCPNDAFPHATITGVTGGRFSVDAGASIDSLTGELDLSTTVNGQLYTVTYLLPDVCQSFFQRQIIVIDDQAPDSISLSPLASDCGLEVPVPSTLDNCAGTITGTTNDPLYYNTAGTYIVNWTFDDGNGNQIQLAQDVVVGVDSVKPIPLCQNISVTLDSMGIAVISAEELDNGSFDNCAIMSFEVNQDTFRNTDLGDQIVSLTVTDSSGNSASCTSIVTVTQGPNSVDDLQAAQIKIFPNPASSFVRVDLESNGNGTIEFEMLDAMGRRIQHQEFEKYGTSLQAQFDVQDLTSGLYLIVVKQDGKTYVNRFLKN
ncbi:MAG: T9SS type A sorting domain-containing protein [Bacteroidota bacterium]